MSDGVRLERNRRHKGLTYYLYNVKNRNVFEKSIFHYYSLFTSTYCALLLNILLLYFKLYILYGYNVTWTEALVKTS